MPSVGAVDFGFLTLLGGLGFFNAVMVGFHRGFGYYEICHVLTYRKLANQIPPTFRQRYDLQSFDKRSPCLVLRSVLGRVLIEVL